MTNKTQHTLPAWAEIEYTASCKSPYLTSSFFMPKVSKVFLCRENGTKEETKMIFLVFKPTDVSEDAEWDDDPTPGEIWVNILGDNDEEIEPVKTIYLGMDIDDFIRVTDENEHNITFDIYWRYGEVKLEKSEHTDLGYTCKKEDFGDDGLMITFFPKKGKSFTMRLQIPYLGFSLYHNDDQKLHGDVIIPHDKIDDYVYDFIGDENNDRFSLHLDNDKLIYLCVFRPHENKLAVRDQREKLAIVDELPSRGKLSKLMMNAHEALVKNKNHRWHIILSGTSLEDEKETELVIEPRQMVAYAHEQFLKADCQSDNLGVHLISLEQKYAFQWCWLKDNDWSHTEPQFDMFMKQLIAFSFINQKPIQGDLLQARNNKRKIRRCAKKILAHQADEINLWKEPIEVRQEILNLFSTYHKHFIEVLEAEG